MDEEPDVQQSRGLSWVSLFAFLRFRSELAVYGQPSSIVFGLFALIDALGRTTPTTPRFAVLPCTVQYIVNAPRNTKTTFDQYNNYTSPKS